MIKTKICNVCQKTLPIDKYYKMRSGKDGLNCKCIDCLREYTSRLPLTPSDKPTTGSKPCTQCKKLCDVKQFSRRKLTRDGLRSECKDCNNRYRTWQRYKVTLETVESLREKQNNECAICKTKGTSQKPLNIDHDHDTKKIRGLLCGQCNIALGNFRESIDFLTNAVKYLKKAGRNVVGVVA